MEEVDGVWAEEEEDEGAVMREGEMVGGLWRTLENNVRGVKMLGPALIPYWRSNDVMDMGSAYARGSSSNGEFADRAPKLPETVMESRKESERWSCRCSEGGWETPRGWGAYPA